MRLRQLLPGLVTAAVYWRGSAPRDLLSEIYLGKSAQRNLAVGLVGSIKSLPAHDSFAGEDGWERVSELFLTSAIKPGERYLTRFFFLGEGTTVIAAAPP